MVVKELSLLFELILENTSFTLNILTIFVKFKQVDLVLADTSKIIGRVTNNTDSDQTGRSVASDLGLRFLLIFSVRTRTVTRTYCGV